MTPCEGIWFTTLQGACYVLCRVVQVEKDTTRSLLCPVPCGPGAEGHNKVLKDVDTYISVWPPEHGFLHKHHCENSEPLICIFSYEKLFILIQEHLLKPPNFLITSNFILLILSDKLITYSLWIFPNISNLNPVKQWGWFVLGWGVKKWHLMGCPMC